MSKYDARVENTHTHTHTQEEEKEEEIVFVFLEKVKSNELNICNL